MNDQVAWSAGAILLLGIWHGVNPGMGWLFAVALGMQERSGRAVWRALVPLAAGHGVAIAIAVVIATVAQAMLPVSAVRWIVAVTLVGAGLWRLMRNRHPRYGGMRMSATSLATWSMLMASAHGAGLMVVPFVLGTPTASSHGHAGHFMTAGWSAEPAGMALATTAVHTAGYLVVTGLIAVIVYRKLGLRLLRTMWVNVDVIWGIALVGTGCVTPWL